MKIEITPMTMEQVEEKGITSWSIWTCEISEFDWEYTEKETCYLLEGEVEVTTNWETVKFGKGDFVKFPKGLICSWKVSQAVKKHYQFN